MKDDSAKKEFIKLFDEVSEYEGGAIYNYGILKGVRTYDDYIDILCHTFKYAESRGQKVKEIINSLRGLQLIKEVIEYACWYESLSDSKKTYLKEKAKREHFKSLKEGVEDVSV